MVGSGSGSDGGDTGVDVLSAEDLGLVFPERRGEVMGDVTSNVPS